MYRHINCVLHTFRLRNIESKIEDFVSALNISGRNMWKRGIAFQEGAKKREECWFWIEKRQSLTNGKAQITTRRELRPLCACVR